MRIAGYTLIKQLDTGSVAQLWLARAKGIASKHVLIKIPDPSVAASDQATQSFLAKAEKAIALEHEAFVATHEVGMHGSSPYVLMEYIEGEPLDQVHAASRDAHFHWEPELVIHVARELLFALDYAHIHVKGAPIYHGSLSSANVLITTTGALKLINCGVPRSTTEQTNALQTRQDLRYVPPGVPDTNVPRWDLYPLGVILIELLSGRRYRPGDPLPSQMSRDDVPSEVMDFVRRLLGEPFGFETAGQALQGLPDFPPQRARLWQEYARATGQLKAPAATPTREPTREVPMDYPELGLPESPARSLVLPSVPKGSTLLMSGSLAEGVPPQDRTVALAPSDSVPHPYGETTLRISQPAHRQKAVNIIDKTTYLVPQVQVDASPDATAKIAPPPAFSGGGSIPVGQGAIAVARPGNPPEPGPHQVEPDLDVNPEPSRGDYTTTFLTKDGLFVRNKWFILFGVGTAVVGAARLIGLLLE